LHAFQFYFLYRSFVCRFLCKYKPYNLVEWQREGPSNNIPNRSSHMYCWRSLSILYINMLRDWYPNIPLHLCSGVIHFHKHNVEFFVFEELRVFKQCKKKKKKKSYSPLIFHPSSLFKWTRLEMRTSVWDTHIIQMIFFFDLIYLETLIFYFL
jgi:hypothetical protein